MLGHVAFGKRPRDQKEDEPEGVVDSDGNPNYSSDIEGHLLSLAKWIDPFLRLVIDSSLLRNLFAGLPVTRRPRGLHIFQAQCNQEAKDPYERCGYFGDLEPCNYSGR